MNFFRVECVKGWDILRLGGLIWLLRHSWHAPWPKLHPLAIVYLGRPFPLAGSIAGSYRVFPAAAAAAAAKLLQSCLTLCGPVDGSPPGSSIPGILQARTLEWVAISLSNAWKWKVKVKSLSRARLPATPWFLMSCYPFCFPPMCLLLLSLYNQVWNLVFPNLQVC